MSTRLCKIALVASAALFLAVVVFNNLTDYDSNFQFVRNVLNMSTTFPGNRGMWRAIDSPAAHHVFYSTIILWEAVAAGMIAVGAARLWRARASDDTGWQTAKALATLGLSVSLLQWFVAFLTVGGEWFLMWQSKSWNGQDAAFRMFAILGLILVFLRQPDESVPA